MDTNPTLDHDFSQYLIAKQAELEAIAAYVGKDETQNILTIALQEIGEISPPIVTSTAMIKDPYDYILLVGKLVEKRKRLLNQRQKLEIELQESLALLSTKLGTIPVSDRLAAWLAKYNLRTSAQIKTASQIANIAVIEKLLEGMRVLL